MQTRADFVESWRVASRENVEAVRQALDHDDSSRTKIDRLAFLDDEAFSTFLQSAQSDEDFALLLLANMAIVTQIDTLVRSRVEAALESSLRAKAA